MSGVQDARRTAELRAGLSDTTEGYCEDLDWPNLLATINIGGARQAMPWAGVPPWPGGRVAVVYSGNKPRCWAVYGASQGTVASVNGTEATVTGDDGQTYIYPAAVTVTSGNRVRLDHGGQIIVAVYPADPTEFVYVPPAAPPVAVGGSATFRPIDSGNYRFGVYQGPYVEISDNRVGAYFYGTQLANTIPDSATITKATLQLAERWDNLPGTPSKLGTHTQPTRGSTPAISGAIDVYGGGSIGIMQFADALKTGAAYGVGFAAGFGWRQFDTSAASGAIYMEWST